MAALKLLLSQARRHSLPKCAFSMTSHRSLCASSESNSNPPRRPFEPIPIQPVSYPVKPKPAPPEPQPSPEPQSQSLPPSPPDSQRAWTREDIRYVKDVPSIAPVAYASRGGVAPLPDDRAPVEDAAESERRMIEAENEMRLRMAKAVEEERMKVPFPLLIKPKKNEKPPPLDLNEAIRQVKLSSESLLALDSATSQTHTKWLCPSPSSVLLLANAKAKFDETVEAHIRLGVDSKRTEMAIMISTLAGSSWYCDSASWCSKEGAEAEEAKAAGADIVGGKELIEEIASNELISFSQLHTLIGGKNKLKVDKCFSTPGMAPNLGKIAQYLRKRRLMPDKKVSLSTFVGICTLTSDIAGQLKELRQGRVEFKMESKSILHVGLGKVSYKEEALRENISAFMNAVLLAKPAGLKKSK
ncbi:hypothetical protein JHK85_017095 [Glycine max]|nr:hypothetical protein JHK85_017095 [Glycine max]